MSPKSFFLSQELHDYVIAHSTPADPVIEALIERTAGLGDISMMQVAPQQATLMQMLVQLTGTDFAVEVGTFTGLSAISIARGLNDGGRLLCCDVSEEWTAIARDAWAEAGVADRIELKIAPAIETLRALPDEPGVDFAFIDADKASYIDYWNELVPRLRPGGLLAVDNVLWSGTVLDTDAGGDTAAIQAFNDHAVNDARVDVTLLTVSDGITLARKK
ncbi:MAG: O-methyltransferase [Acidimicrobiales bacterium]|nr:O-methyltransferase [Acidimicrobiales bacterium]